MKKYWKIWAISFQEFFSYRGNFFLEVAAGLAPSLMMIGVWMAIFRSVDDVGGYGRNDMIGYLLVVGAVNSFLFYRGRGDEVNDDIHRGNLSFFLARPMNVPLYWFIRDASKSFLMFLLSLGEILILLFFFRSSLAISFEYVRTVVFVVSLASAFCLQYLLFHSISILAFWMEQTWGARFIFRVISDVAGGVLFPLALLPSSWQTVASILPFRYILSFPAEILLGRVSDGREITLMFLVTFIWIVLLFFAAAFLWKRGVRAYSAPGS